MGVLHFLSTFYVPALLLSSVTKVDAFIGFGIEMYNPSCAFSCRTLVATYMLDCSNPMLAAGGGHSTYFNFLTILCSQETIVWWLCTWGWGLSDRNSSFSSDFIIQQYTHSQIL